ncbi:ATP-dependent Clp protease proteolytic subunit [Delftia lacustris]|jgi:hypothetical protein
MRHHLIYHGEVNLHGVTNLEKAITASVNSGASEIVVSICSGGGDVMAGIGAYNFIRMQPIPVKTYAFGYCGSIAATVFMAGSERISSTVNSFALHAASYSEGPMKDQISPNTKLISMPFEAISGWDPAATEKYFGSIETSHLSASESLSLGISTSIQDIRFEQGDVVTHISVLTGPPEPQPASPKRLSELLASCALAWSASVIATPRG